MFGFDGYGMGFGGFQIFQLLFLSLFWHFPGVPHQRGQGYRPVGQNNRSPRLTVNAAVVAKRENVNVHHHHGNGAGHTTRSTTYYVTFQFDGGDRLELRLPGREYGLLTEGDTGLLTFQGTRYLSFERQGTAVSYQAETSEGAENGNRGERRSWDPEL